MMRAIAAGLALTVGAGTPALAVNVNWTDWTSYVITDGVAVVTGILDVNGTEVTVEYTNENGIGFAQTAGGTDYWQNGRAGRDPATSPYTSVGAKGVDNIPDGTDIVALDSAGGQTLSFSEAIADVYFAFVSLNGNGYGFDRDFTLLSSGGQNLDGNGTDSCGYWGCGTASKSIVGDEYRLVGTGEPHGVLMLNGSFSSVSWNSLNNEFWNGFTVGVAGIAPPDAPAVPVPAAGWLALAGLGALGGLRRFRRG